MKGEINIDRRSPRVAVTLHKIGQHRLEPERVSTIDCRANADKPSDEEECAEQVGHDIAPSDKIRLLGILFSTAEKTKCQCWEAEVQRLHVLGSYGDTILTHVRTPWVQAFCRGQLA
jgi:hypothetical protein